MKTVSLIGAPTDVGASVRGAGMGPDALARGRHRRGAARARLRRHRPRQPGRAAQPLAAAGRTACATCAEVVAWNRAVFEAVVDRAGAGQVPLLMGGDHCLAIGSISAVARQCREQRARTCA